MNITLFLLGVFAVAAGIAGWVANARVHGNPLARGEADGAAFVDGGFTATATAPPVPAATGAEDPFTYEGKVNHVAGFKRRIFASFWLIIMIAVMGAAFAGGLYLIVRLFISQVMKYVGG